MGEEKGYQELNLSKHRQQARVQPRPENLRVQDFHFLGYGPNAEDEFGRQGLPTRSLHAR